jgi:hypothetical protein
LNLVASSLNSQTKTKIRKPPKKKTPPNKNTIQQVPKSPWQRPLLFVVMEVKEKKRGRAAAYLIVY